MGDRAKFTNPVTWVSLAPVLSSSWIQNRREKIETGVARKSSFNPSAPRGFTAHSAHTPAGAGSLGHGSQSVVPRQQRSVGLSLELIGNAKSQVLPQTY